MLFQELFGNLLRGKNRMESKFKSNERWTPNRVFEESSRCQLMRLEWIALLQSVHGTATEHV